MCVFCLCTVSVYRYSHTVLLQCFIFSIQKLWPTDRVSDRKGVFKCTEGPNARGLHVLVTVVLLICCWVSEVFFVLQVVWGFFFVVVVCFFTLLWIEAHSWNGHVWLLVNCLWVYRAEQGWHFPLWGSTLYTLMSINSVRVCSLNVLSTMKAWDFFLSVIVKNYFKVLFGPGSFLRSLHWTI